jgi:hypothetical protein
MEKKVYLMIGLTGSGKSTLGNCIINGSGELTKINDLPFGTSNDSSGCTREFIVGHNDQVKVIDSIGFCDPQIDESAILNSLKRSLERVNNQVNCVLFVVKQGRFTNEVVNFFRFIQEKVLRNRCLSNSILIVTGGTPGWVETEREKAYLKRVLENCGNRYYEFSLKFDHYQDDDLDRSSNINRRHNSIKSLSEFLESKNFGCIDLSHIQSEEFSTEWRELLVSLLLKIFNNVSRNAGIDESLEDIITFVQTQAKAESCSFL